MKAKLDVDLRPYRILGAATAAGAPGHQRRTRRRHAAAVNVVVREEADGKGPCPSSTPASCKIR